MFDVAIVGGGPVGACAAALLARGAPGGRGALRVALLEPDAPEPLPADAPLEARVVALSRASERTLTHAGRVAANARAAPLALRAHADLARERGCRE